MKKTIISLITALALILPMAGIPYAAAEEETEKNTEPRIMEKLDRGLVAVKVSNGVYLSWRLLGTERLSNQAFDIYRDGEKIYTTGVHDATCYTDTSGKATDTYKVVKAGTTATDETEVTPWTTNAVSAGSVSQLSESNSFAYTDIPIVKPEGGTAKQDPTSRNGLSETVTKEYTYSANDASVGDLDGDGDYEIVLKWDPSNSEDSGTQNGNYTGNVYIDGYQTDNAGEYMWRIDLGCNIRAGAHYTQFIVYDFDGDGKAEIAMKTAPGSKDGQNKYVTEAGDTDEIKNADNSIDYRDEVHGGSKGRILTGPEYLTIFDGETGAAIYTTDYIPRGTVNAWGDNYGNRSERYLAGVAYLDGVHPSLIMTRGYYMKAAAYAYNFDGKKLNKVWECNGNTAGVNSLYGQGAHSLSIADIDNDGKDEIVYCSAAIDDDGTVIGNTQLGHGDALHVSDFNNDGVQEAFSVKEDAEGYTNNAADFRIPKQTPSVWGQGAGGDTGRGVIGNIDDAYAQENSNALSLAWSSSHPHVFGLDGNVVNPANKEITYEYNSSGGISYMCGAKPSKAAKGSFDNFLIYWDGDLGRELLDDYVIQKYYASTGNTRRFYTGSSGSTFSGIHHNNDTKRNMSLVADILGDWREEVIAPLSDDSALRIFMSTIPTTYRLTTLMHDSQYRCAIAWQNVGYNQPPHTSYYIGSAALAKDGDTTLNYLAPAVPFTVMTYPGKEEEEEIVPDPPSEITTNTLWSRGIGTDNPWTTADSVSGTWWSNESNYDLKYNSEVGRILFETTHASSSYEANVNVTPSADATVLKFDVDWYFGGQANAKTSNASNYEYIQFGSKFRIGWSSGYKVLVSTDGGSSYGTDYLFSKDKSTYTKKVTVEIDISNPQKYTVKSFTFDGTNHNEYAGTDIGDNSTLFSFGLTHNSDTPKKWSVSCGIDSITVTEEIPAAQIASISATATKSYKEGGTFNKSDITVTANYDNGTQKVIESDYYTVTGYDKTKTGTQTLTVKCGGKTTTVDITVTSKELSDITLGGAYKTAYNVGEELDTSGLTVTANYDNGASGLVDISECTVTGYDKTKAGEQTVTVNYNGKTAAYTVTSTAVLTGIAVSGDFKRDYLTGETLDLTGMTVTASYNDNTSKAVTEYTVSGYNADEAGEQTVTVSYEGETDTFTVNVTAPRTDPYIEASGNLNTGITAGLKNFTGSAKLILAVYDGTALKELQIKDAPNAVFDAVNGEYTYKILAWQSLEYPYPICEKYEP